MAEYVILYRSFDNIYISQKLINKRHSNWKENVKLSLYLVLYIENPIYTHTQTHEHTQITTIKGVQQGYRI